MPSAAMKQCQGCRGQRFLALPTLVLTQGVEVQLLHLLSRPRRFAQKPQAGSHARVEVEAAHRNALAQLPPAIEVNQVREHALKR
jgi:hypothetical protein